jgi:hypothetical protein
MKPRHLQAGGFIAVLAAMSVLLFDLHIAWFFVAASALLVCSFGGWTLERKQRRANP